MIISAKFIGQNILINYFVVFIIDKNNRKGHLKCLHITNWKLS